ncbi:MAG: family 43 glycosylhydrolase [Bacteroidales bacterium]|nr:family 43 glycosylhydrolase [Bacteroidales bacterium]
MKSKILIILLLNFSLAISVVAQKPILPDFHADPSAHKWDGKYWIYPSTDEPGSTSWLQMRRWECYYSINLADWKHEGEIFNLDSVSWADQAAFAPDCMKWNEKYYFFFPADFNIGVAVSDRPNGPFNLNNS